MSINNSVRKTLTYLGCALVLSASIASGQTASTNFALDPQLEQALRVGRPLAGLDVTVAANHVQLNSAEYRVRVMARIAPGSELTAGRAERSPMDVVAMVADASAVEWHHLRDQVVFEEVQGNTPATDPMAYAAEFTMLPGRYTVRFVVRDQASGRIGTADASFVVRNLARTAPR